MKGGRSQGFQCLIEWVFIRYSPGTQAQRIHVYMLYQIAVTSVDELGTARDRNIPVRSSYPSIWSCDGCNRYAKIIEVLEIMLEL
jgi:hypothetical protein